MHYFHNYGRLLFRFFIFVFFCEDEQHCEERRTGREGNNLKKYRSIEINMGKHKLCVHLHDSPPIHQIYRHFFIINIFVRTFSTPFVCSKSNTNGSTPTKSTSAKPAPSMTSRARLIMSSKRSWRLSRLISRPC